MSTGNRIGEFDTEAEALSDVRHAQQQHGQQALNGIALILIEDATGQGFVLAEGEGLILRAAYISADELLKKKFPPGCTCTYYEPTPCPIHDNCEVCGHLANEHEDNRVTGGPEWTHPVECQNELCPAYQIYGESRAP